MRTFAAILEYCGGEQTDQLHKQLCRWNSGREICVFDNASPKNRCSCVTVQSARNVYIGGGIVACMELAQRQGSEYLFLVMNDVVPITAVEIAPLEEIMNAQPSVIQISASLAGPTPTTHCYPWMAWRTGGAVRPVFHADILCSLIRIAFVQSFGGFPPSRGAWGYDWELAYQARRQSKQILISDRHVIFGGHPARSSPDAGSAEDKREEMRANYLERYDDFQSCIWEMVAEYKSKQR